MNYELELKKIIMQKSRKKISVEEITDESNLIRDFGYDSIKLIELIVDIEIEFDICFEDTQLDVDVLVEYRLLRDLVKSFLD